MGILEQMIIKTEARPENRAVVDGTPTHDQAVYMLAREQALRDLVKILHPQADETRQAEILGNAKAELQRRGHIA